MLNENETKRFVVILGPYGAGVPHFASRVAEEMKNEGREPRARFLHQQNYPTAMSDIRQDMVNDKDIILATNRADMGLSDMMKYAREQHYQIHFIYRAVNNEILAAKRAISNNDMPGAIRAQLDAGGDSAKSEDRLGKVIDGQIKEHSYKLKSLMEMAHKGIVLDQNHNNQTRIVAVAVNGKSRIVDQDYSAYVTSSLSPTRDKDQARTEILQMIDLHFRDEKSTTRAYKSIAKTTMSYTGEIVAQNDFYTVMCTNKSHGHYILHDNANLHLREGELLPVIGQYLKLAYNDLGKAVSYPADRPSRDMIVNEQSQTSPAKNRAGVER